MYLSINSIYASFCRSLCGFVDWNPKTPSFINPLRVEAYAASWIEISAGWAIIMNHNRRSLCGFVDWNQLTLQRKLHSLGRSLCGFVDWNASVQKSTKESASKPMRLRGLKSQWCITGPRSTGSKPMRLRGLKSRGRSRAAPCFRRSLCGFVDWNFEPDDPLADFEGRSLCGFVDWNWRKSRLFILITVEAYAASWIEIILTALIKRYSIVEAYAASWIEISICGYDG